MSRVERLSIKLLLAVGLFMLLLLVTVVTAVNLGLTRLQSNTAGLSTTALTQQRRADLQEQARLEATISNNRLARAANLTRIAADYLVAATDRAQQSGWNADYLQTYPQDNLRYDANPNRITDLVIPSYVTLDDTQRQRLAQSALLDNLFPALLQQAPEAIAIYHQEVTMVFRYYPAINVVQYLAGSPGLAPANANYLVEDSPAAPRNNPQRLTVWDPPYADNAGQGLLITANTPVYVNDEYQGIIAIDLSLARLVDQLQHIQPTPGSYAFIVDEDGRLVAAAAAGLSRLLGQRDTGQNDTGQTSQGDTQDLTNILGISLADSPNPELAALLPTLVQGQAGLAAVTIGGEATLLAYAAMADLGWSLGIVTPVAELTAPADALTVATARNAATISRLTLGLVIFFFVAALVGVFFVSRRLMRPIADLVQGTAAITAGDLDHVIPVTTTDELGDLAALFNKMTVVLRQARASLQQQNQALQTEMAERQQAEQALRQREEQYRRGLEQRVAERTQELTTLLEVSHGLTLTLTLPELLQLVVEKLYLVVPYAAASIATLAGDTLEQVAYRGAGSEEDALAVHVHTNALGTIWQQLKQGEPVIIQDLDEETAAAAAYRNLVPSVISPALFEANHDLRAWMAIPLRLRGQTVGLLALQHGEPGYFSHQRLDLALAFATQAAIAIENAQLYEQAQSLAALKERQKLARELHDSVSQALYGIALGTRTAGKILTTLPQETQRKLDEPLSYILQLAEAGLSEMRALIFELRPESLATEGLVVALEKQTAALRARHQLDVRADLGAEPDLPLPAKEVLYRVAQEALHNIVKHAGATEVTVRLARHDHLITLTIGDNGQGFDPAGHFPGHLGLTSMRERVERRGGEFQVHSAPNQGTTITVALPDLPE